MAQVSCRTLGRHDQARGPCARIGARSRDRVPRRADFRPRPDRGGRVRRLIQTLQQTLGLTVFMVTHDLDRLNTICDRVAVLADGRSSPSGRCAKCFDPIIPGSGPISAASAPDATTKRSGDPWKPAHPVPLTVLSVSPPSGPHSVSIWLHNTGGLAASVIYRVHFQSSVSGLLAGAAVLFNGIRVGEVTDLGLARTIRGGSTPPSRSRRRRRCAPYQGRLDFQGLTGVPVISLQGGTAESRFRPR